jgi:UDP-N-acetylmuramoyl-tripeptide--D-alanyl-D-alanine ligase
VAQENATVFAALPVDGTAVFPANDEFTPLWTRMAAGRKCVTFGEQGADLFLAGSEWLQGHWAVKAGTPAGPMAFQLHIAGRHNVRNALAAAGCALAAGVPLEAVVRGLESFEPVKGRSRAVAVQVAARTLTLIDDTYNANPDSVRAAIDVLAELPGPRLLVLGDMGEVGNQGPAFHQEVGDYARQRGIEQLFTLGELAVSAQGRHFADVDALNVAVLEAIAAAGSVLVKGSRFMKMERVVQAIASHAGQQQQKESRDAG